MPDLHQPFDQNPATPTLEDLQKEHSGPPRSRHTIPRGEMAEQRSFRNYVRDLVLGFNDGLVSTYAATAGVAGAFASGGPTGEAVGLVGVAIGSAGAMSMAIGEYISTKSQQEYYESEARREKEHIQNWPHLEAIEVREALEQKGLSGETLDDAVDAIASDPEVLLDFMMREEFGLGQEAERNPWSAAGLVMMAFLVGATIPVTPYFIGSIDGLAWSSAVSGGALFLAGAGRARLSDLNPWRKGIEMTFLGVAAALITFAVGRFVGGLVL